MCIMGTQKTQEAKHKIIHDHKQFTAWSVLLGLTCVFSQLSIHFYVIKITQLCIMLFHKKAPYFLPFQSPKAMSILITKNTLHQLNLEGKKRNLAFLGNKNFKDKNGNRPLDKHIGRAMIKILHSLNVQLKWDIKQHKRDWGARRFRRRVRPPPRHPPCCSRSLPWGQGRPWTPARKATSEQSRCWYLKPICAPARHPIHALVWTLSQGTQNWNEL